MKFAVFYMYKYMYDVIYTGNIYMVIIMHEAILIKLRKILD